MAKKPDKPDAGAMQKVIDELREQLAAATAGTAVAQLEAEKAALKADRDQVMTDLADVSAKLEASIAERTKLAEALEDARIEFRNLQNSGVRAVAPAEPAPVLAITGPAIEVRTKPGRQQTRYRAGRAFGPQPVPIALADLAEGDLDKLMGDPELVVTTHKPSQEA
ncbi:hypothetical protein [Bradyrhizobium sp. BR 10289]|uniref:hypothetical protein n=1 Tax=Bradyrhizobium sp. BR 10289 TaxID=2749993 RepID=UPI001C649DEB|nr:hypothetical protein [Bradyrhizobium sp. BR 10289]MBW7968124.1 hypothetical protein [Bradyrhizobium sp. BR 10289]